jgi:hypothetical protein
MDKGLCALNHSSVTCAQQKASAISASNFLSLTGVGDVGGFEAEAARLQAPKQCPDLSPPRVVFEGRLSLPLRHDDHIFTAGQPHPGVMPPLAPDDARPAQRLRLPDAAVTEQPPGLDRQPAPVRDPGVGADAARYACAPQIAEPLLANKLPVGAEIGDAGEAEQAPELIQKRDAFGCVRATLLRQHRPQQGEGRIFVDDAEDKDVQRHLTQVPVGAVERARPRRRRAEQLQDEGGPPA